MDSADQVLSAFIAAGQVWYIARPDGRPAQLTDVGHPVAGHDGVCLFPARREALAFLRATSALPGQFRPRRGAPHPRRPGGVGAFVRACRRYAAHLCLPRPADGGRRFDLYFLEIRQLLAAARRGPAPSDARPAADPEIGCVWPFRFDYLRVGFSVN